MTEIDRLLAQIGDLPLDPRLDGIDGAVFAGLAEATAPLVPRAAWGAVAGIAVLAGMLATALPGPRHEPVAASPLGMPTALAPSTLLAVNP